MLNKQDRYLHENISIQLDSLKKNMRDFTHYSFKKMKVFDPNQELKGLSNEEIWTDSPTMVSTEAATRIIESLLKFADSMNTPPRGAKQHAAQLEGHPDTWPIRGQR
jgi:hypothetical protein